MANEEPTLRISRKATRTDTRTQNRRFVLQRVFADAPTTRADIARATGLTRAAVSQLITELIDEGLVFELGTGPSAVGKPPTLLAISDSAHHLITIELGRDRWSGSVMTLRRRVLETATVDAAGHRAAPTIDAMVELIETLRTATRQHVMGIGIAMPGVVAPQGRVVATADLDWDGMEVGRLVREQFGIPTYVINDVNAITLAEFALGNHGTNNLFVVKVGAGIGAGIILDGRPYTGEGYAAGEIGHMAVLATSSTGETTLEAVASARALARQLDIPTDPSHPTSQIFEEVARRVAANDPEARRVVDLAGRALGVVLAGVTGILDIRKIVITGPARCLGPSLLEPAREEISHRVLPAVAQTVVVDYGSVECPAEHGAAMLVLNREIGIV
jgi:predicted NBD/HSP70 family sugar kinase